VIEGHGGCDPEGARSRYGIGSPISAPDINAKTGRDPPQRLLGVCRSCRRLFLADPAGLARDRNPDAQLGRFHRDPHAARILVPHRAAVCQKQVSVQGKRA